MMSLPLDVQGLGQAQTCSFQNFFEVNKYYEKQLESHMFHFSIEKQPGNKYLNDSEFRLLLPRTVRRA